MTDPRPEAIDASVESPGIAARSRRRLVWLVVVVILFGLAGRWVYHRINERPRVLAAIEAAGGKYHAPNRDYYFVRMIARLFGQKDFDGDYDVFFGGPKFDDAWLAEQNDLRAVPIGELVSCNTQLSREAALRLLDSNRLFSFIVPGIPLTDADCQLIGEQEQLTHLSLMQSEITDAGLAVLNPKRLRTLNVAGTCVTSAGLQKELAGSQLQYLLVDGQQFTPELAAQLAQMKSLNMLSLIGPDVTDAHIKLLESVPNATYIGIDQTSATEAAIKVLRATKPNPASVEVTTPETMFAKWRTE